MQKIIFGIFAHPDDEAFGPSGTLLMETQAGTEVHLVTLTAGEHGMNPDNHDDLGKVRLEEWRKGGKLIGATGMHHLGYIDGTLGNNDHIAITLRLEQLIRDTVGHRKDVEVEIMSMDLNGVTGHIDHIVAGRSACLAYYRLKASGFPVSQVRLSCVCESDFHDTNTDFVYMEAGRPTDQIDEIVDARHLAKEIHEIIRTHHTQRWDGENHIAARGDNVALNYFMIKK